MDGIARHQYDGTEANTFDGNIGFKSNDNNSAATFRPSTTKSSSLAEPMHVKTDIAGNGGFKSNDNNSAVVLSPTTITVLQLLGHQQQSPDML